jgi:hypothetical protein
MFTIDIDQLLSIIAINEEDDTEATTEASTLGLGVGDWPEFIAAVREQPDGKSAVGSLFVKVCADGFGGMIYSTNEGQRLVVLND